MKPLILFTFCIFSFLSFSNAQTGPAGVGNSNNNILWLDASSISAVDNSQIGTWNDISGNNNHAYQTNSQKQPIYIANKLNGQAAIEFDGINDLLDLSTHILDSSMTFFTVFKSYINGAKAIFESDKHFILGRNIDAYAKYDTRISIRKLGVKPSIFSLTSGAQNSGSYLMTCDLNSKNPIRSSFHNSNSTTIGGSYITVNYSFNGYIPEIIIFNNVLNSAERNIVINYLSSKYDLPAIKELYSYEAGGYSNEVMGIGQETDGNHVSARSRGSLLVQDPSDMDNGEYLLVGNNSMGFATTNSVGPGILERWKQVWRADKTGDPGTVDLEFFLGSNGFASQDNYVVLIENQDGDFSNGDVTIHESGRSFNIGTNSIKFEDLDIPDGAYFTLAEKGTSLTSIADGNWNNPEIWSCGCVPSMEDLVIANNSIVISNNQSALSITINNGGSLSFNGSDTLFIYGDFEINGSFNSGTGTIAAVKYNDPQSFTNTSNQLFTFYNLFVNNQDGLFLQNGDWTLTNNLQVINGGMDVSQTNSMTLISNASKSAQILPSMDSAFVGDFLVQRYIGPRNAGWADLSSPVQNATVADWDDDIYISGVNGNDGNATIGNTTYYSMFTFDNVNSIHKAISSTSTPLKPGKGYEIWLADNPSSFFGQTIDVKGAPNSGNCTSFVNQGWNFMGNPYQSFINYDDIIKNSWVPDSYYIWNTANGSYDFFTGSAKPPIAPGQGFWIYKSSPGATGFVFTENIKLSSHSSSFLRTKNSDNFCLNISSSTIPYSHKMTINFSILSSNELDEKDAFYLKSKLEEAPAITTKASNSERKLIYNSLDPFKVTQYIPISIYTGTTGEYHIQTENLRSLGAHYNYAVLLDKKATNSIDLFAQANYTFKSEKGTSDRFELILSNSPEIYQDLMRGSGSAQESGKNFSIRNSHGQWYLDYNLNGMESQVEIQLLNMNGQKIRNNEIFDAKGSGTHQLHNLEDLNGLFLIQVKSQGTFLNKVISL